MDAGARNPESRKNTALPKRSEGCPAATWRIVRFARTRKSYDSVASKAPTPLEPRGKEPVRMPNFSLQPVSFPKKEARNRTNVLRPPHRAEPIVMPDDQKAEARLPNNVRHPHRSHG